ncbi:MAG: hypothetical protein ACP5H7_02710 [Minisyncoccia bacterium]
MSFFFGATPENLDNENKEEKIKNLDKEKELEEELEEKELEKKQLRESDAAKGDLHSTDKSEIPAGVSEEEFIKSFEKPTSQKKSENNDSDDEYYDTGIRPHVKLPPDESDEFHIEPKNK